LSRSFGQGPGKVGQLLVAHVAGGELEAVPLAAVGGGSGVRQEAAVARDAGAAHFLAAELGDGRRRGGEAREAAARLPEAEAESACWRNAATRSPSPPRRTGARRGLRGTRSRRRQLRREYP
jgi:hypothetical protein